MATATVRGELVTGFARRVLHNQSSVDTGVLSLVLTRKGRIRGILGALEDRRLPLIAISGDGLQSFTQ